MIQPTAQATKGSGYACWCCLTPAACPQLPAPCYMVEMTSNPLPYNNMCTINNMRTIEIGQSFILLSYYIVKIFYCYIII